VAQGEWKASTQLIDAAIDILEDENPMTVRQLFYRLVSQQVIKNHIADYQKVIRLMTKARKDGRIDYDWIVDRSRASYESLLWNDMNELARTFENDLMKYRTDWWCDQPNYVEIWCEKDTVTGSIEPVREEFGLRVDANRGFNSTSNVHTAAERLMEQYSNDKDVVILYLGDWDPSGEDMERDLRDRLLEEEPDLEFTVRRVAIHKSDIRAYDLPPLQVKNTDTRAKGFVRNHGDDCVELDAMSPSVLRDRLRIEIENLIEDEDWERAKRVEAAQRETNKSIAATIKQMVASSNPEAANYPDPAGAQ
jgi:hypothetical protein